ncbi:MAG: hypothetical protein ACLFSM_09265 [Thermoplasmata archaeon]
MWKDVTKVFGSLHLKGFKEFEEEEGPCGLTPKRFTEGSEKNQLKVVRV